MSQISPVDNANYQSGFSFGLTLAKTKPFTTSKNKTFSVQQTRSKKRKKPIICQIISFSLVILISTRRSLPAIGANLLVEHLVEVLQKILKFWKRPNILLSFTVVLLFLQIRNRKSVKLWLVNLWNSTQEFHQLKTTQCVDTLLKTKVLFFCLKMFPPNQIAPWRNIFFFI